MNLTLQSFAPLRMKRPGFRYGRPLRHGAFLLPLLVPFAVADAARVIEHPELARHFAEAGVTGCFVVLEPENQSARVHNPERVRQRFRPASTYKIPHALMGLESGAVRSVEEVIPYGGGEEYLDSWERDMSLREAMAVSNVAVFHQLARRIGLERTREFLERFEYGNADPGDSIARRYWIRGPLEISALEQAEFLARLTSGALSAGPANRSALADIILFRETAGYSIHAKSGLYGTEGAMTGWWVGWVERRSVLRPFALNIDVTEDSHIPARIEVALACLETLGILD